MRRVGVLCLSRLLTYLGVQAVSDVFIDHKRRLTDDEWKVVLALLKPESSDTEPQALASVQLPMQKRSIH